MLFSNKKGVSPLVATMLLIAFAIALGAVVINLGANITSESHTPGTQTSLECNSVNIEIIGDTAYYYKGEKQIKISIKNLQDSLELKGIDIGIQSENEYYASQDDPNLKQLTPIFVNQPSNIYIPYNRLKKGQISEIWLTPILANGEICYRNQIQIKEIVDRD